MPEECSWPACREGLPLFQYDQEEDDPDWWCATHVLDDFLPELSDGAIAECASCGESATLHLPDGRAMHVACRRAWAASQVTVERTGAYARRK
jgi:hypothetical protein